MDISLLLLIALIIMTIVFTVQVYYNTIVTKKWRDQVINESECWKWGLFYYNPMDKRIFLPKRSGLGMTMNFAHPVSSAILCGLVEIIILSMLFGRR